MPISLDSALPAFVAYLVSAATINLFRVLVSLIKIHYKLHQREKLLFTLFLYCHCLQYVYFYYRNLVLTQTLKLVFTGSFPLVTKCFALIRPSTLCVSEYSQIYLHIMSSLIFFLYFAILNLNYFKVCSSSNNVAN